MSERPPVYFTGVKHNRLTTDFLIRPVGDLVEVNGTQFTASDAASMAIALWQMAHVRQIPLSDVQPPWETDPCPS